MELTDKEYNKIFDYFCSIANEQNHFMCGALDISKATGIDCKLLEDYEVKSNIVKHLRSKASVGTCCGGYTYRGSIKKGA